MLLDRKKYMESAYIGEELFSDPRKDRLHTYMIVEKTIADGDFSFEEALDAYNVDKAEYENYIARNSFEKILNSISGTKQTHIYAIYLDVVAKMLNKAIVVPKIFHDRLAKIQQELITMSNELKAHQEKI